MKKIFTAFILLTLASCSAYEDWDHRGPETPALREQKMLMLPPNFKEEAPIVEDSKSATLNGTQQTKQK